jgi:hypothetical protein
MAPELLQDDGNDSSNDSGAGRPTVASDMYAAAMVVYEVRRLKSKTVWEGLTDAITDICWCDSIP